MGLLTRLRMINWSFWFILLFPITYIVLYIWVLRFKIIPWLSITAAEIYTLTLIQIVFTICLFTGGFVLLIVCLIFVLGMILS